MTPHDDDAWLDALAGRIDVSQFAQQGASGSNDPMHPGSAALEALALREFIRRQESATLPSVATVDPARESELIVRALREGLLASREPRAGLKFSRRRPLPWRIAVPAAAVILIAVVIGFRQSLPPPPASLRGVGHGTVQLEAADPHSLRRQLTEELRHAGATVAGYERFGRLGIDADLPQPLPKQITEILERHHIPIPADGVLVVEIKVRAR